MAGNTSKHRSGSTKELDHLINRRREIAVTDDIDAWTKWAVTHGVTPLTIAFANQHSEIVFTQDVPTTQGPWCTPRSLVDADRYMQILHEETGAFPDDSTTLEEIAGDIGQAAAVTFFSFVRLERELPKFEAIVRSPDTIKIPQKPDGQMLSVYNLAHRVCEKTLEPVIVYIERLGKEFAVTFAKAACQRNPQLVINPAMRKWSTQNASLMAALTA